MFDLFECVFAIKLIFENKSIQDLSNEKKSCKLHLILPIHAAEKWNQVLGVYEKSGYSCFHEWEVLEIAQSIDKRWKLVSQLRISTQNLVSQIFKRYQLRHNNGVKWNAGEHQSINVGYYVLERRGAVNLNAQPHIGQRHQFTQSSVDIPVQHHVTTSSNLANDEQI